jgi:H+/Cl- antiporter ClcA
VNAVIAVVALAAGVSEEFTPMQPSSYIPLTVIGLLAGAAGWAAVQKRSRRPTAVLRWLVPVVVAASLLPDVALLVAGIQPNTTGLGVAALMVMHMTTAAIAVPIFARALPLPVSR